MRILAQVFDDTAATAWFACQTGVATMQNQPVMRILAKLFGHYSHQPVLDLANGFSTGNTCTIAYPEDMRIYGNRRLSECCVEYHIGCFATYTGQGFKRISLFRYLASMLLQEDAASVDNIQGLGVVEPNGLDMSLQAIQSECQNAFRCIGDGKELCRSLVDADICGLGRKNNRDE